MSENPSTRTLQPDVDSWSVVGPALSAPGSPEPGANRAKQGAGLPTTDQRRTIVREKS